MSLHLQICTIKMKNLYSVEAGANIFNYKLIEPFKSCIKQNLATVILWQSYYSKIRFKVLVTELAIKLTILWRL